MTIHPGLANFLIPSIREINKKQLQRSIETLLDSLPSNELMICLENMPQKTYIMLDELNIEEIISLMVRMKAQVLSITLL